MQDAQTFHARSIGSRAVAVSLLLATTLASASPVVARAAPDQAQDSSAVTQISLPDAKNWVYDVTAGPDGALWFAGTFAVVRCTVDGDVTSVPLPEAQGTQLGIKPGGITVGPDKNLWVAEALLAPNGGVEIGGAIVRITPDGNVKSFALPTAGHVPGGIVGGPDGALWFTAYQGTPGTQKGFIDRITTDGKITEFPLPSQDSVLYGMVNAPDGAIWFIEGQSDARGRVTPASSRVGRIDTRGAVKEFALADGVSTGGAMTLGPDGAMWFTEGNGRDVVTRIGRITTDGTVSDFPLPNPISNTGKNAIITGPDGALWFSYGDNDTGPSALSSMTTDGTVTDYPLDTGVYPWDLAVGPDGALWMADGPVFTDPSSVSSIGRFTP